MTTELPMAQGPVDVNVSRLLPCPFCGGEASPTAHLEYSWFAPVCKSCGVRGPSVRIESGLAPQKLRELLNKANDLWNRRVTANAEVSGAGTASAGLPG